LTQMARRRRRLVGMGGTFVGRGWWPVIGMRLWGRPSFFAVCRTRALFRRCVTIPKTCREESRHGTHECVRHIREPLVKNISLRQYEKNRRQDRRRCGAHAAFLSSASIMATKTSSMEGEIESRRAISILPAKAWRMAAAPRSRSSTVTCKPLPNMATS